MDGSTWWHPAVLVALLLRLSKLTQTDNCYPSLVHWIDFLLHGFPSQKENKVWVKPKKKRQGKKSLLQNTARVSWIRGGPIPHGCCCWLTCDCPALIKTCLSLHGAKQLSTCVSFPGFCLEGHLEGPNQVSDQNFRYQKTQCSFRRLPAPSKERILQRD